ncbi:KEOPS complex subunit Cgi121 [Halonotius sp. GCM10025705]|uniref:KEOPS complex subunit Cgi121 n=1 Tax=Halonotius sp. GCM10025705 TaxID=3252678 RepID=UPI00360BC5B9
MRLGDARSTKHSKWASARKAGVVAVVSGGDESAAEQRVRDLLGATDVGDGVPSGDADTIKTFFDIGDAEMAVVDGDLEAIVLERVALLDVEK